MTRPRFRSWLRRKTSAGELEVDPELPAELLPLVPLLPLAESLLPVVLRREFEPGHSAVRNRDVPTSGPEVNPASAEWQVRRKSQRATIGAAGRRLGTGPARRSSLTPGCGDLEHQLRRVCH